MGLGVVVAELELDESIELRFLFRFELDPDDVIKSGSCLASGATLDGVTGVTLQGGRSRLA